MGSFGVIFGRLGGRFAPLGASWKVILGVLGRLRALLGGLGSSSGGLGSG